MAYLSLIALTNADETVEAVGVEVNGDTSCSASLTTSTEVSNLETQITDLQKKLESQELMISQLNATLNQIVLHGQESGFLENIHEEEYFGLVSSQTHPDYAFTMLHVMSVRLPARDAMPLNKRKKHGSLVK